MNRIRLLLSQGLEFGLQPALMVIALAGWLAFPAHPMTIPILAVGVQIVLGVLEYWQPARPDWMQPTPEKLRNIAIFIVLSPLGAMIVGLYAATLAEPLAELRASVGLDVWPTSWPLLVQVFLAFFLAELIWYWIHRAEHRFGAFWRVSGHGAHHSFKRLGAINSGLNHPLELFLIVLPSALVELLFGAGLAALGSVALSTTLAAIAHTNLKLNTTGIGSLFTTNLFHIRHHSIVLEESNTNYGCASILWDRVFGTFSEGPTVETGIGPTEPGLWSKVIMPIRDPADSQVSPVGRVSPV